MGRGTIGDEDMWSAWSVVPPASCAIYKDNKTEDRDSLAPLHATTQYTCTRFDPTHPPVFNQTNHGPVIKLLLLHPIQHAGIYTTLHF